MKSEYLVIKGNKVSAQTTSLKKAKQFGPKSGKLAAIFNFFDVLPVQYTLSLGLLLQMILGGSFGGGSLTLMMIIGISVVAFYTMLGGFRGVVFSDFIPS